MVGWHGSRKRPLNEIEEKNQSHEIGLVEIIQSDLIFYVYVYIVFMYILHTSKFAVKISFKPLKVLFLTEPENENPNDRNRSIGMTLANKFIVSENDYFDLCGVHSVAGWWNIKERSSNIRILRNAFQKYFDNRWKSDILHIIWASCTRERDRSDIMELINEEMKTYLIETSIVTFLSMEKLRCFSKENHNSFFRDPKKKIVEIEMTHNSFRERFMSTYESVLGINPPSIGASIGDDHDHFIGQMIKVLNKEHSTAVLSEKSIQSFQLTLLTDDEMHKLRTEDTQFLNSFSFGQPDVSETEMAISESDSKYALFICNRKTVILHLARLISGDHPEQKIKKI